MSYNEFFVGQKVVCISGPLDKNNAMHPSFANICVPKIGSIYTIREILPAYGRALYPDIPVIYLKEIVNKKIMTSDGSKTEPSWYIARFRPLVTTNINIFKEMCKDPEKFSFLEDA